MVTPVEMAKGKRRSFSYCLVCKRPLVKLDLKTGRQTPIKSRWPYCVTCFERRRKDPEFIQWLAKKINHAKSTNKYIANPPAER